MTKCRFFGEIDTKCIFFVEKGMYVL